MPVVSKRQKTRIGAYALVRESGEILLVQQALGPHTGKWGLPGGAIDFGESPQNALMRELEEECGLKVEASSLSFATVLDGRGIWQDPGEEPWELHWFGIVSELKASGGFRQQARLTGDGESAGQARWFSPNEVPAEGLSPFFEKLLKDQFFKESL